MQAPLPQSAVASLVRRPAFLLGVFGPRGGAGEPENLNVLSPPVFLSREERTVLAIHCDDIRNPPCFSFGESDFFGLFVA